MTGPWLTVHILDGENAGRAMHLPLERIVGVVALEGGAGLAFDDGGTMQVKETGEEVALILSTLVGDLASLEEARKQLEEERLELEVYEALDRPVRLPRRRRRHMVVG